MMWKCIVGRIFMKGGVIVNLNLFSLYMVFVFYLSCKVG